MRPSMGAVTLVKSRLSRAASRADLAARTVAAASSRSLTALSSSSRLACPAFEAGLAGGHVRLGLFDLGLVGTGVDLEQHVALLDVGPFLEGSLDQIAGDAGPQGDGLARLGASGEVLVVGHLPGHGPADGHLRGRGGGVAGGGRRPARQGQDGTGQEQADRSSVHERLPASRRGAMALPAS